MKWQIVIDGRTVEVDKNQLDGAKEVEPGVFSVLVDGRSFEVRLAGEAQADGRRFRVEVRNPRDAAKGSKSALGGGRQNITAPMPGKVIRLLVKKGDAVNIGAGLVVVEAMKMQNEMKAPRPAHVLEVRVQDGDTVTAGQTLLILE
jgi:biotin carboxyl carrier protein